MKILLVEDDKAIAKGLSYSLVTSGYQVEVCHNYEQALQNAGKHYDLMIFDITLPDGDGFELYQDIQRFNPAPVIFLTALDDENHIVRGLDLGAQDYITKPFSTRELLARIRRIFRDTEGGGHILTAGDIALDTEKQTVSREGESITLTALEYRILLMLMQNVGKTVTRDIILERIWDISGNYVNDNTLTVYIRRIRQKLGTDQLKTVKGIGYRMEEV